MPKRRYTKVEQLLLKDLLDPLIVSCNKQIIHARACRKILDNKKHRGQENYWTCAKKAYTHALYLVNPKTRGPGRAQRTVRPSDSPAPQR